MQILFGARHDACHIAPDAPDGYEWWYFDALSGDGRYALVAIFFLGSPMSPYYKAVVDGRSPVAKDWCGVFFALHENFGGRWRERSYAYNLYSGGQFSEDHPAATVGGSTMRAMQSEDGWIWQLDLNEPGLWREGIQASLRFSTIGAQLAGDDVLQPDSQHTWVCVAPECRVSGTLTLTQGTRIDFEGIGYHDHNFGCLPWNDAKSWYWGRVHFDESSAVKTAVFYHVLPPNEGEAAETTVLLYDRQQRLIASLQPVTMDLQREIVNAYGFRHATTCVWPGGSAVFPKKQGRFAEGPFYRRLPVEITVGKDSAQGIGEIFQPSRLCGPIASRAMWTRMRRRS